MSWAAVDMGLGVLLHLKGAARLTGIPSQGLLAAASTWNWMVPWRLSSEDTGPEAWGQAQGHTPGQQQSQNLNSGPQLLGQCFSWGHQILAPDTSAAAMKASPKPLWQRPTENKCGRTGSGIMALELLTI